MEPYWNKLDPKEAARRRKVNRVAVFAIGAGVVVFVALSPAQGAWLGVLGIFVVVAVLFYGRSIVFRNIQNKLKIEEAEFKEKEGSVEEEEETEPTEEK